MKKAQIPQPKDLGNTLPVTTKTYTVLFKNLELVKKKECLTRA